MGFGELFLSSKKGIGINIANLKDNIKREDYSGNSKLQAIFDMFDLDDKKDGILSTSNKQGKNEIRSIFEQLGGADANTDGIIDDVEAKDFLQKFLPNSNITSSELFTFLTSLIDTNKAKPTENSQTSTKKPMTEAEVQSGVIESLRADTDETLSILQQKNNGKISDMYDSMKEFFNSDTSSAKVMEAAVNQAQGAKSMEKAQKGELTQGEYIRENKARLKEMMKNRLYKKDKNGVDYIDKNRASLNMSRKDFEKLMLATIERMTDDMDIKDVKEKMRQLPQTTEAGDRFLMDKAKENAVVLYGRAKQAGCSTIDSSMKYIKDTTRTALPSPSDDKLMTFEEVFYYEQGINYSKEACEEYLNYKNELNMKLGAYNKSLQFKTESEDILKEKDAEKALNKLIELFENFYRNPIEPDLAFNNLQSIIQSKKLPIHLTQDENGKINMSVEIGSDDLLNSYVSDILSAESDIQKNRLNEIFGGKSEEKISDLQEKVETAHEKAYGNDFSSTLGKMMMEDNKTFIQRYSGYASMTGMGLMLVGGVLCMTPAAGLGAGMIAGGQTLAMTGMASESILGYTEAATREHGAEDGEYEELTKNLIMNAGGFIIGYRAGKAGDLAFQKLIGKKLADTLKINITQKNYSVALKQVFSDKELLLNFMKAGVAKISSDFLISFAGDLIMMGILDTNDDVLSLLKSNLMGIVVGTSGDIASTAKLGKKGKTYEALIKKEKEGKLSKQEADALNKLRQDPDIQKAYNITTGEPKKAGDVDVNSKEVKGNKEVKENDSQELSYEQAISQLNQNLTKTTLDDKKPDVAKLYQQIITAEVELSNGKKIPRFKPEEQIKIKELCKENPELVEKLINDTFVNELGQTVPRVQNASTIISMCKYYQESPEIFNKLYNMKLTDINGNEVPRFNNYDLDNIFCAYMRNPEYVSKLLDDAVDYKGITIPKYNGLDIEEMSRMYIPPKDENSYFEKALNALKDGDESLQEDINSNLGYFLGMLEISSQKIYKQVTEPSAEAGTDIAMRVKKDIEKAKRTEHLEKYIKNFPENPKSDELYNQYLEREFSEFLPQDAARLRDKCKEINKNYGVKIILSSDLKEVETCLKLIEDELSLLKQQSNGKVKLPPVLSFLSTKPPFGAIYNAGYSEVGNGAVNINGMTVDTIKAHLKHEITHTNDTKNLKEFPKGFLAYENNSLILSKCKYYEDLKKLGLSDERIEYAYTNPMEIIAVASEGDLSKCTPELKQALIDFGMPEWMFNLDVKTTEEKIVPKSNEPLNEFDSALKDAALDDEAVQKELLKALEQQYPSLKGFPGRLSALKKIQELINSPEYEKLDVTQREVAKLILLRQRPRVDTRSLFYDSNLSGNVKRRMIDIENCLKQNDSPELVAALYKNEDFETLLVLLKLEGADESVINRVKSAHEQALSNGCLLVNNTKIDYDQIETRTLEKDGKDYNVRVLDCTDSEQMAKLGLSEEEMRLTVHMNDEFNKHPQATIGKMRQSESLNLSVTSTDGKHGLYGNQQVGIVLEYDAGALSYASNYAAGTGFVKTGKDFGAARLSLNNDSIGTFVRQRFIENLKSVGIEITLEDYMAFSKKFHNKSMSVNDLRAIAQNGMIDINGKKIPLDKIESAFCKSTDDLMNTPYEISGQTIATGLNELNVYNPDIKAIYVRANSVNDTVESILAPEILAYAEKHNIPIVFQKFDKTNKIEKFGNETQLSSASPQETSTSVDISNIQDIRKFGEIFNRMFVGKDITAKVLQDAGFSNEEIASLREQYSKLDILTPIIRELININEISSKEEIIEFIEYNTNDSEYLAMVPYINNKNIEWLMQAGNMDRGEALEVLSQIYGEKSLDINTFKDGIIRAQKENISFQEAIKKNHQEDQFLLEELTNKDYNKEIADEIINFQSKSEALDCEYDNVLSGLDENGFKMMKILMDASKKGDNEFIQNIHNIRMIVDDLQKYFSVDEVEQIINMKNDKGEPIINRNSYDKLARNKFDDINLPMTPEKLNNIKNQLRERFVNITDKYLDSISSQIKDSKSATLISRLLSEKNQEDNKFLYNLDMIEAAAKYLNKYPDNKYIIEMIHNKTQNISDNKFFDVAYPEIIKMLENCKSDGDFIINELLKPKSENIHWRLIGFACHSINNCSNYRLAQDVAGDLLTRYWENDYNAGVLAKFTDEKSILLIQKMVNMREADNSQTYTNTDITKLMTKYQLCENKDIAGHLVETIIENKLHINAFDTLLNAHNYDTKNGTHCKDFAISILSIKDEQGVHKYSARTIEMILSNLPQPIKDKNLEYVKSIIIKYPTLTTKEILDIVKGRSVEIEPVHEYPFGENGIFAKEYSRITTTEAYKQLPQEIKSELFDYLNDLVKQDPNRFKRLVDSGYFELCSQGKLDINDLISNIGTRKFFSKNFLNDVKRMSSGEPLVKEYPSGTSLSKIASEVDIGEVASLDGKLYVNDNGKMVQLKITKEKLEELFPLESRFNSKQGSLGDCWLVSALDELMDVPNGRAKLYQLFEQNGNDITVTIPSKENVQITNELEDGTYEISWKEEFAEPYKITFKNGMPIKSKNGKQINGCKGFQLIEQAYSYNRAADFDKEITLDEMEVLFDVDQQMKHLAGGHSREFISSILEYRFEEPNLYDKNNELVGQGMEPSKNIDVAIRLIKAVANSDDILLYASTLHKADNASRLEKDLAPSYDLYSNHAYSIKGFNEERGLVYFTNPWNTNTIVEMDVYTFLDYIDYVTYLKVN